MKKMKKVIPSAALIFLAIFCMEACKKSDNPQSTLQKVQSNWQLVSEIVNVHISGQDNITTITGTSADYVDFRADGKVYSDIQGSTDTAAYALSGNTKIIINGSSSFDITTLTSNSLILHDKESLGGTDFAEETMSLKK